MLAAACGLYLVFSFVQSFPWMDWGLADLRPVSMAVPDKMILAPWRLLDVLALFGRHSLEIFTAGTLVDLYARLLLTSFGAGWIMQVVVNVAGFVVLLWVARNRERARAVARARRAAPPRRVACPRMRRYAGTEAMVSARVKGVI